ncbi:hypothetical protein FRV13_15390 [Escherichia coli]|uniref:hypothetical protein n=1 Tax=Escherichia TaxID=561 RepID=UPI00063D4843|nr:MULTISPECIES: hypothetical protein [Escherichia]EEX9089724.1 hypothetical protein [Escherichia coli]EEY1041186.1 hypothetical protein [Escherichia coli]EEY1045693.1 hypothetical protein [Escherichia coli]EEY3144359.1 hypothetical protein [Escherichia coli]EFO1702077.1 hypothetical protein [Escherichia coli]
MKYLPLILLLSAASVQAADTFQQRVKDVFQNKTSVDYTDWYAKGDTAIAEFKGFNFGVYQDLKASVRNNEINIKMQYVTGPVRPDSEQFAQMTSLLCETVFEPFVAPDYVPPTSWDDDTPAPLNFMYVGKSKEDEDAPVEKTVNGWKIKIERSAMKTTCSARKVN